MSTGEMFVTQQPSDSSGKLSLNKKNQQISRWALQEIQEVCDDQVCTPEIQALPQIAEDDVRLQGLIGEGGFSNVYKVTISSDDDRFQKPLAMKQLRFYKRGREEEDWILAVYDLCNETSMLAKLSHENIVRLEGVCRSSVSKSYQHGSGFFFLMEQLEETLHDRLQRWRMESKKSGKGPLARFRKRHSLSLSTSAGGNFLSSQVMHERIRETACGIASAMSYLHSADFQIAVRDLKPQNVGFDRNGVVKLFDFGMARPVHETDTAELAGTFRYLSPEAIVGHRIGLESDVYSFGVLLFELVTLQKPFDQYFTRGKLTRKDAFFQHVAIRCCRPCLKDIPCKATRRLVTKCWDPSPRSRPSFPRVYLWLNQIVKFGNEIMARSDPLEMLKSAKALPTTFNISLQETALPPLKKTCDFRGLGLRRLQPLLESQRRTSDETAETASSNSLRMESLVVSH